jgi:hypothetical protein
MSLRPVAPPDTAITVSPGGRNNIAVEVENKGALDFSGILQIEGPSGFDYTLDDTKHPNSQDRFSVRVPAKSRQTFEISFTVPKDYARGQHEDVMGSIGSVMDGGIAAARNARPGDTSIEDRVFQHDTMTLSLLDESCRVTADEERYNVKSSGELRNGRLSVSVAVNPGFFADLSHLRPNTHYVAQFTAWNTGGTLMFINGVDIQIPKCVTILPGSRVVTKPKPWKTTDPGFGLCEKLLGVLSSAASLPAKAVGAASAVAKDVGKDAVRDASGAMSPQGPSVIDMADHIAGYGSNLGMTEQIVGAVVDLYMTKYFMQFLQISKVGYPMPKGERLVIEVPFQTGESGSGEFVLAVSYADYGVNPAFDAGSGYSVSAATVQQWEKDFLTKGYTPVGARARDTVSITVQPPPFDKAVESIVTPLQEAGANLGNMLSDAAGFVARMKCPADLHVYDSAGRHVGMNYKTGQYEIEIPGAQHLPIGDADYIYIPDEVADYRVETVGRDTGTYNLDILTTAIIRRSPSAFERVLVPIEHRNVSVSAGSSKEYPNPAQRVSEMASAASLTGDWSVGLREAVRQLTQPTTSPRSPSATSRVGLLLSLFIAFVACGGFIFIRRRYG